ncbi:MAG: RNA polymerase factor sigma-54 [candidate division WOR-3 bacterium]
MRLELGLNQRLDLVLSPQLILNLELLQVPTLELEAMVRQELEENPALEQADDAGESPDPGVELQTSEELLADLPDEPVRGDPADSPGASDELRPGETEDPAEPQPSDEYSVEDLMPDDGGLPSLPSSLGSDDRPDPIELAAGPEPDLREVLLPRLRAVLPEEDMPIAEGVLGALDEDGFLSVSEEELAQNQGVELPKLREILYLIQRIEPGGIGCRNQQQSFAVQLELAGADPASLECQLVTRHWDLLLAKKVDRIAKLCGVTEDEVRAAVSKILLLETRPARRFAAGRVEYVSPDFSVEWRDGQLVAEANEDSLPRLRLSRRYVEILRNPKAYSQEQVKFAREKLARALMFLRGIESRRRTLRRLMEIIINDQRDFFLHGPEYLKPATLKDAAERLGVHPSTASRATAGKYVETCFGIFPLKHFFRAGAGDKSRTSIQERVKQIIEQEDKSKPLSDDEIAAKLAAEGIKIARRTVAKYRDELGIPGRGQRSRL